MTDAVRPYQQQAAAFLSARRAALLADSPRVGKTASAIAACDEIDAWDILWVTTGSARADHVRAWKRFQRKPRNVTAVYSNADRLDSSVLVISYDMLLRVHKKLRSHWDAIVLDEVHKLKGRESKRTEIVYGKDCKGGPDSLVSKAKHVFALSGTPSPNNYAELWPFLRACYPEATHSETGKPMAYWSFAQKFCRLRDNGFGTVIAGNKNGDELKRRIAPITLRRTLADIAPEVPMITSDLLRLGDLREVQQLKRAEQDKLLAEMSAMLNDPRLTTEQRDQIIQNAMKRIDARTRSLTGLAKVEPIVDWLIEEAPEKLVVFAWHTEVLARLQAGVGGRTHSVLVDGSITGATRGQLVERFMIDPECKFFFGQILAAGEAIDLSVADEILFAESSWVPGHNEQAALRVVNVNKTRPTLARFATIAGSIDEKVQSVAAAKLADIQKLFS